LAPAGLSIAQEKEPFAVELEGVALWQSRNDVRIPNDDSATKFSLVDVVGSGPYASFRLQATVDINEKNGLRFVFAPLNVDDTGVLAGPVSFAGATFAPGNVNANYKFSNYRVTYRYRIFNGERWRWKLGATAFIRDARIRLEQNGTSAEDTDVGFVPLVHLDARAKLSDRLSFLVDLDALGASQGRAIDVAAKLAYDVDENWRLAFGYRTIEGGADVESVFNFAWLHFAVASIRYSF
jgi:hypothetical protein